MMHNVAVQIVRFVESGFPGWVECELVDAAGRRHILMDKVPIFTVEDLDADSKYTTPGRRFRPLVAGGGVAARACLTVGGSDARFGLHAAKMEESF
jgi:hypothetical protein